MVTFTMVGFMEYFFSAKRQQYLQRYYTYSIFSTGFENMNLINQFGLFEMYMIYHMDGHSYQLAMYTC